MRSVRMMDIMTDIDGDGRMVWTAELTLVVILMSLLIPVILVGNILVILAVIRFKGLQLPTNYFLVFLASADISLGVSIPVNIARESYRMEITSNFLCLAPYCLTMTCCGASILCLSAIAYDRYLSLSKTFEYFQIVTVKKILIFTVISLIYAVLIAWSPFFDWHNHIEVPTQPCSFHLIRKEAFLLLLCALFLPSYLVIFYSYWNIYRIARKHSRAIAAQEMSVGQKLKLKCMAKNTKYAKTVGIVIGFFVALWLPYQVCILIEVIQDITVPEWTVNYLALLSYCNSAINPWIYAYKNKEFRIAFKKLLAPLQAVLRGQNKFLDIAETSQEKESSVILPLPGMSENQKEQLGIRQLSIDFLQFLYGQRMNTVNNEQLQDKYIMNRKESDPPTVLEQVHSYFNTDINDGPGQGQSNVTNVGLTAIPNTVVSSLPRSQN